MAKRPRKRLAVAKGGRGALDRTARLKKDAFLTAFAATGNISAACRSSGVERSRFYDWAKDAAFESEFQQARTEAVEALELEARRRAERGVIKYKTHEGKLIMVPVDKDGNVVAPGSPARAGEVPLVEHEYSDTLMIFLLKAHRPEMYRDKYDSGKPQDNSVRILIVDARGNERSVASLSEFYDATVIDAPPAPVCLPAPDAAVAGQEQGGQGRAPRG